LFSLSNCCVYFIIAVKAFRKKGAILSFMKQYHRAIPTFKLGLTYHPNDPELVQGLEKCYRGMQGQEPVTEEQKQERLARAMADPEVQNIMKDPMMREVLFSIQSNPASLYDYLRDKDIAHNLEVLIAAGVIGTQ
jgi:stress-induced-phosphoprotein 1